MARFLRQSVPVRSDRLSVRLRSWLRRRWMWASGTAVVVVALLVWGLWPAASGKYVPDPRSRQFSSFTVCVLTGSGGIGDSGTAPVWAGVVDASKATKAQGSYLSVPAPDTEPIAETYVDTLASRNCSLVVAVGNSEVAAVGARAGSYTGQRFVVVASASPAGNVAVVREGSPGAVQGAVARVVEAAVAGRFTGEAVS